MVSTRKKKQQNKRLLGQLDETADDFVFGYTNTSIENTNVINKGHESVNSHDEINSTAQSGSQIELRKNISYKVRNVVENSVATVEIKVNKATSSPMENLVVLRMELAMRSVGFSSVPNLSIEVLDVDQRDFSGDTNNQQMTASSRFNSNTNLNGIDETHGNIIVEDNDLPVGERSTDREAHAHHNPGSVSVFIFLSFIIYGRAILHSTTFRFF